MNRGQFLSVNDISRLLAWNLELGTWNFTYLINLVASIFK